MTLDLQSVSVVLGIASSLVALAFKLKLNTFSRLKSDLELLKLARDAKANYLPIQRHVDSQIRDAYVARGIDIRKRFEIYSEELIVMAMFGVITFGFLGSLIALAARAIFAIEESTTGVIIFVAAALGLMGGIGHGRNEGERRVREIGREIEMREKEETESDETEVQRFRTRNA